MNKQPMRGLLSPEHPVPQGMGGLLGDLTPQQMHMLAMMLRGQQGQPSIPPPWMPTPTSGTRG